MASVMFSMIGLPEKHRSVKINLNNILSTLLCAFSVSTLSLDKLILVVYNKTRLHSCYEGVLIDFASLRVFLSV